MQPKVGEHGAVSPPLPVVVAVEGEEEIEPNTKKPRSLIRGDLAHVMSTSPSAHVTSPVSGSFQYMGGKCLIHEHFIIGWKFHTPDAFSLQLNNWWSISVPTVYVKAELQRMAPACPVSTCSGVYHDSRVNNQGEYSDCVKVRWPSWRGGSIQQQSYNTAVPSQHFCQ